MDFEYDETEDIVKINAYPEDICSTCREEIRNRCPLLICISSCYVYPCAETLEVRECLLYEYMKPDENRLTGEEPS